MTARTLGALIGGGAGVLYGLVVYLWLHRMGAGDAGLGVMIASYLFLVPFVLGLVSVALTFHKAAPPAPPLPAAPDAFGDAPPPAPPTGLGTAVGVSASTTTVFLVTALVLGFEGVLCAFIAAPVMYVMAALGAGVAYLIRQWSRRGRAGALLFSAALPALLGPLEQSRVPPTIYRTVSNDVLVHAPPEVVWSEIRSVRRIQDREIRAGWVHAVGLPRPREALLRGAGVGAVRTATFDGGLSFTETVTDWEDSRLLSFRIQASDPGHLDPHVQVGGRFFDVMSGTYRLEALAPGVTLLHLSSTQRVSTPFNGYTAWFTQAIMRDLQRTILYVVQARAERQADVQ
ncbi:SRPBCC family protein (plasmid) [Deinococcus taeanensis]|uniref:SRPBCC family protein n=1 Tax=Deinococcus taeanensis TaxID=2737050 RepID=UPI001CDC9177|nr:SRPBCC family protein [Deinococcus taeanensis]UBV44388.1 SRPBCC family protein [Deinococcus taeanensis]